MWSQKLAHQNGIHELRERNKLALLSRGPARGPAKRPEAETALWKCRAVDAGGKRSSRVAGHPSSTSRFPTVAHRPWKSQTTRFPHSHSHGDFLLSLPKIKTTCAVRALATTQARRASQSTSQHQRSGPLCVGMKNQLQAHVQIEECGMQTFPCFRQSQQGIKNSSRLFLLAGFEVSLIGRF
jgi:hypothetical protein